MLNTMRFSARLPLRAVRYNSTASSPPLLSTLRTDLKTAMKTKDTVRLNVLRAIISETNNAAKTSSPVKTDLQLLSIIRKRATASKEAGRQFAEANRNDLKEKEDEQVAVLEEYAGKVETTSPEEIQEAVSQTISQLQKDGKKVELGAALKLLFAPGGALDGKPAEKSQVAAAAKELISKL